MPSEIVDGQDVDAVEATMARAVARARSGGGPTLIEAKTYRYAGHSRSDKATYRPAGELDMWLQRDPIKLFGAKLVEEGVLEEADLELVDAEQRRRLEATLELVLSSPTPTPAQMMARVSAGGR
jgi:pyruvate dehydrogenase E1 component alpha subunit